MKKVSTLHGMCVVTPHLPDPAFVLVTFDTPVRLNSGLAAMEWLILKSEAPSKLGVTAKELE